MKVVAVSLDDHLNADSTPPPLPPRRGSGQANHPPPLPRKGMKTILKKESKAFPISMMHVGILILSCCFV